MRIFAENIQIGWRMKKTILIALSILSTLIVFATAPERKMLEQGKLWAYNYHHFEDNGTGYDESVWNSYYQLNGDTIIGGRQYMKLYRWDDHNNSKKYFAAFREDETGRVYMLNSDSEKEVMVLDFSLHYERGYFPNVVRITETIKEDNQLFRRIRYQDVTSDGSTYDLDYIAVEGVGFQGHGLMFDPYAPEPDCICDYESLAYVYTKGFWFNASAYNAPKEIELSEGEQQLIVGNNDFAFKLFRKARGDKSCIMSPLSITYALGLLNNGAAGQTQQEINQVLGFGEAGVDGINQFCHKMLQEAETLDSHTKSLIANTIFVNEGFGYRLQDDFTKKAHDYYNAEPQNRDFADGQTMDVINQWASDHTEGLIKEVLNEDSFDPTVVSYLLNALYFKGMWSSPFDAAETKEETFGSGAKVPMMHKHDTSFDYTENELYQAVNLPYGNGAYLMTIFLPCKDKTIGDVLESLNGSNWQVKKSHCDVDLKLPRFETNTRLELVEIMADLGMPTAFTGAADFPYFCNVPIYIGNMFQVAKIKLDEEGTEAAAVTVIEEKPTSTPYMTEFHATRPFFYVISEQSTGSIFFMGQYTGDVTTDIQTMNRSSLTKNHYYNLQGQRISSLQKGLNIVNGRKVLVK